MGLSNLGGLIMNKKYICEYCGCDLLKNQIKINIFGCAIFDEDEGTFKYQVDDNDKEVKCMRCGHKVDIPILIEPDNKEDIKFVKLNFALSAEDKLNLIMSFHENYYNTNQNVEVFAEEFFTVVEKISNGYVPVKLDYLTDFEDDAIYMCEKLKYVYRNGRNNVKK